MGVWGEGWDGTGGEEETAAAQLVEKATIHRRNTTS